MKGTYAIVLLVCTSICYGQAVPRESQADAGAFELVKRLDAEIKRRYRGSPQVDTDDYEIALSKLIKMGSKAEKALELKVKADVARRAELEKLRDDEESNGVLGPEETNELERLSTNVELLTALRRIQKKRDPISIQLIAAKEVLALPGKLPTFSAKLKSVDVEKMPVWLSLGQDHHGTHREAQWRFEVKDAAGKVLPILENEDKFPIRFHTGHRNIGWLKSGDYIDTYLRMGEFIHIPKPGEYTVTLLYHSQLPIADYRNTDLNELIVFRSQSIKLTVSKGPKLPVKTGKGDRKKAAALISDLPGKGVVKVVGGVYHDGDFEFVKPDSAAGKILTMNWRAVPALLDALSDAQISRHQKAWVLSLLYTITAEEDLNPIHSDALPHHAGRAGKLNLGGVTILALPLNAAEAGKIELDESNSESGEVNGVAQDDLIKKWKEYRHRSLDIRETEDR